MRKATPIILFQKRAFGFAAIARSVATEPIRAVAGPIREQTVASEAQNILFIGIHLQ